MHSDRKQVSECLWTGRGLDRGRLQRGLGKLGIMMDVIVILTVVKASEHIQILRLIKLYTEFTQVIAYQLYFIKVTERKERHRY